MSADCLSNNAPVEASVVYRQGPLTDADYLEAIEALEAARSQLEPNGDYCAVCADSDHQAWECRHNPLVMARRSAKKEETWRCFHCDVTFGDADAARDHFGYQPIHPPVCKRDRQCLLCKGTGETDPDSEARERTLIVASLLLDPCTGCADALRLGAKPRSDMRCPQCKGGLRYRLAQMKRATQA